MKNITKLYMISILLTGCMDTVTRFWNYGPVSAENKQWSKCSELGQKNHPEGGGSYGLYLIKCMKNKGYNIHTQHD